MRRFIVLLSLGYLLLGILWIVFSDWIVFNILQQDPEGNLYFQTVKGIGYVAGTALLLYFLLRWNQKKLKEASSRFEMVFMENPVPMWIYDSGTFEFLEVNDAMLQKYRYSREELLNMDVLDIRPVEMRETFKNEIAKLKNLNSEGRVRHHIGKDGQEFFVKTISTYAKFKGRECRLVLALGIEEEVKFASLLKLQNEKLSAVEEISSHDVRKHLSNILGLAMLLDTGTGSKVETIDVTQRMVDSAQLLDLEIRRLIMEATRKDA